MLSWFRALMPKEERFFNLFEAHAARLVEGAQALRQALDGGPAMSGHCREVVRIEHEADALTREVLVALRRSFITPFDRSDIGELITTMDDAIDAMQHAVKAMTLFEVTSFEPPVPEIGDAIVVMADLVARGVPCLRQVARQANSLTGLAEEITRIEGTVDDLYDRALKGLLRACGTDAMRFLAGREVLESLEAVADAFDDVGNRLSGIVIEQA